MFRRLSEAVSARYLRSERRGRSLRILAEYFLGRWSGKLRPASLPGLSLLLSDRKVHNQGSSAVSCFVRLFHLKKDSVLMNIRKLECIKLMHSHNLFIKEFMRMQKHIGASLQFVKAAISDRVHDP